MWQQWPSLSSRALAPVLEPDLMNPLVSTVSKDKSVSVHHTWTSFSPSATCFTSSKRAALSGLEFRLYAASRVAWSSGLDTICQKAVCEQTKCLYLVLLRFCRGSGLSSVLGDSSSRLVAAEQSTNVLSSKGTAVTESPSLLSMLVQAENRV